MTLGVSEACCSISGAVGALVGSRRRTIFCFKTTIRQSVTTWPALSVASRALPAGAGAESIVAPFPHASAPPAGAESKCDRRGPDPVAMRLVRGLARPSRRARRWSACAADGWGRMGHGPSGPPPPAAAAAACAERKCPHAYPIEYMCIMID